MSFIFLKPYVPIGRTEKKGWHSTLYILKLRYTAHVIDPVKPQQRHASVFLSRLWLFFSIKMSENLQEWRQFAEIYNFLRSSLRIHRRCIHKVERFSTLRIGFEHWRHVSDDVTQNCCISRVFIEEHDGQLVQVFILLILGSSATGSGGGWIFSWASLEARVWRRLQPNVWGTCFQQRHRSTNAAAEKQQKCREQSHLGDGSRIQHKVLPEGARQEQGWILQLFWRCVHKN